MVALPFFIPVDWVKEQAQTQVSEATGRQLSIDGDVSLSIFPNVVIDRSNARPAIAKTFQATGVQAEPLLIAATGFDKLSGTAELSLDITTTGVSQKQFVEHLFGNGSFVFRDGHFKGANIAAMVRDLSLDALGSAVSPDQQPTSSRMAC